MMSERLSSMAVQIGVVKPGRELTQREPIVRIDRADLRRKCEQVIGTVIGRNAQARPIGGDLSHGALKRCRFRPFDIELDRGNRAIDDLIDGGDLDGNLAGLTDIAALIIAGREVKRPAIRIEPLPEPSKSR